MDIILPVAGFGSRLRPQTWSKPKPLVSIAGRPMLAHVLDRILPLNPGKLIFITGFLGDQIETWVRANYDVPLSFVEQPSMLGQTDAIARTRNLVSDDALILFPDMLFEADFSVLSNLDADGVMFTKIVDDPSAFGIAVVEGDRIIRLIEKPAEPISTLAVIGIYYIKHMAELYAAIDEQMARGIKLNNEFFIADAIQIMIDHGGKIVPAPVTVWEDCGNADALLCTNRYLLNTGSHQPPMVQNIVIVPPVYVDPSAIVERCVLGPYASIGAGAVVHDAIVRDSIIDEGARVELAIIEGSIVGRGARVNGRAAKVNVGDTSTVAL